MQTGDFLRRVLPADGYYVATVINPDRRAQKSLTTIDDLAAFVLRVDAAGGNVYYAMSSFVEAGNRKQVNVRRTKSLFIDVDCGEDKPFADQKEGLLALKDFLQKSGMPKPMIVNSGRGLHVYWPLTEELEPAEWKPLADALKAASAAHGFEIDRGITGDSARILRPVGTHNPKNGVEVTLLRDSRDFTPDEIRQHLSTYISTTPALPVAKGFRAAPSSLTASLATTPEYEPAVGGNVYNGCAQVRWAVDHQHDVEEPFWYALMGVAAFCEDSEVVAVAWSDQHPDYDYSKTVLKVEQWRKQATGPTTCKKFKDLRPNGCAKCIFSGKITAPTQIGRQFKEAEGPIEDAPDQTANEVKLPKGFKRTTRGSIAMVIDNTDIEVSPYDLYPVGYGKDEALGYEVVRYHWKRPHRGWQELKFRQAFLTDGHREFATAVADQGIVLAHKKQTEYFQLMLRNYMDELRRMRTTTNLYTTLGWKDDNSIIVMGEKIIRHDGQGSATVEDAVLSSAVQRLGSGMFGVKGDHAKWLMMTRLLQAAGLEAHKFALGVSMSSLLYQFTGLKGVVLSLYGPTGSGKTLAQLIQQSVWGNPLELHFGSKYTQNALFNRLSFYCNFPMTIDETTMMPDKEVGDFIYGVTQGRDKSRLTQRAEERDARTWAAPVTLSTNRPMGAKLLAASFETDAQLARLLELSIDPSPLFTNGSDAGRKLYEVVTRNYGHVGLEFAKRLVVLGEEAIQDMIAAHTAWVPKHYGAKFTGEERYWEMMIVLADLANKLANEWGLVDYDHESATTNALVQCGMARKVTAAVKMDSFDLLSQYLNEFADATVTVMHTDNQQPMVDHNKMPRGEIRARYDVYRKTAGAPFTHGVLMVDKVHFRRWLSTHGGDWKSLSDALERENLDATPASGKAMLGKNTPTRTPQTYVVGINLAHGRLRDLLNNVEEPAENMTLGQLRSVSS